MATDTFDTLSVAEQRELGSALKDELAVIALRPVTIQFAGEQVHNASGEGAPLVINVDADTIAKVRQKPQAQKLFAAVAYRQFGHLLAAQATAQYATAAAEGFGHLFHILNDEDTIRRLIAAHPAWMPKLQALNTFLFPARRPRAGELLGATTLGVTTIAAPRRGTVEATADYAERLATFAYHFRRQVALPDTGNDPVLAAVNAANQAFRALTGLTKDAILTLARSIHETLSVGITPEVVEEEAPVAVAQVDAEMERVAPVFVRTVQVERPETVNRLEGVAPATADERPWWKNPWVYGPILGTTGIWAGIFLKGGLTFMTVMLCLVALVGCGFAVATLRFNGEFGEFFRAMGRGLGTGARAFFGGLGEMFGGIGGAFGELFRNPASRSVLKWGGLTLLAGALLWVGFHLPFFYTMLLIPALLFIACCRFVRIEGMVGNGGGGGQPQVTLNQVTVAMVFLGLFFGAGFVMALLHFGVSGIVTAVLALVVMLVVMGVMGAVLIGVANAADQTRGPLQQFAQGLRLIATGFVQLVRGFFVAIWSAIRAFGRFLKICAIGLATGFLAVCSFIGFVANRAWVRLRRAGWRVEPSFQRAWSHLWVRVLVITAAPGFLAAGVISMTVTLLRYGTTSWPLFIALVTLSVITATLLIAFRKQIGRVVMNEVFVPLAGIVGSGENVPLDMETSAFERIEDIVPVEADAGVVQKYDAGATAIGNALRPHFERLGIRQVERQNRLTGHDIGDNPEEVLFGNLAIRTDETERYQPSVFFAAALDCSTSTLQVTPNFGEGEAFAAGQQFCLGIDKALAGLTRIANRFFGYVDSCIYDAGVAGEKKFSGLSARGGNNDTAVLSYMRTLAIASGKQIKILTLVCDVQPTDNNTWRSLADEVARCERDGIIVLLVRMDGGQRSPVNIARVVNLFGQTLEQTAGQFGQKLDSIDVR